MLLAFSPSRDRLNEIVCNLEARIADPVVAVDRAEMVQRIVELNAVDLVLLDRPDAHRAWLRGFAHRFPNLRHVLVGVDPKNVPEMLSILPAAAIFPEQPLDWDEVAQRLAEVRESAAHASSIVAVGAEDVLQLLGMTGANVEVEFSTAAARGRLTLHDGIVVEAVRGERSGIEVAYELLDWPSPNVTSRPLASPSPRGGNLHISPAVLLHEVALRRDERCRFVSSAGTQQVFGWLAELGGVEHVGLVQLDAHTLLLQRGRGHHTQMAIELVCDRFASCGPSRRNTPGTACQSFAQWTEEHVIVAIPLPRRLALTLVAAANTNLAMLRDAGVQAASVLRSLSTSPAPAAPSRAAVHW